MRGRALAAAVAAVTLLLTGCSDPEAPPVAQARPSPTPQPPPVCPLTGEDPPTPAALERPAVAVKIENSPQARPQSGLVDADVVFEEIVEGGITRFLALYHCDDTRKAGPVRSARFDDPKIAAPFTRVIAFSGGNSFVEKELDERNMVSLTELNGGDVFYRVPPGSLDVHSLFVDVRKLRNEAQDRVKRDLLPPTSEIFRFGEPPASARKARKLTINFHSSNAIEYRYRRGVWKRFESGQPFRAAEGGVIAPANVLVMKVRVDNSRKLVDVAGNASPDILLKGKGKALMFRDGKVIRGTWDIREEGGVFVLTTKDGEAFTFARGTTWIELVPSRRGEVKGSISFR